MSIQQFLRDVSDALIVMVTAATISHAITQTPAYRAHLVSQRFRDQLEQGVPAEWVNQ